MKAEVIGNKLHVKWPKVTPQRIGFLETIIKLNNHATIENGLIKKMTAARDIAGNTRKNERM